MYSVKFIKSFRPFYNKKVPEIQEFLELYQDIEKKDFIKPIYSETNKYNSFPSFTYKKKFKKGGHGGGKKGAFFVKKGKNAWQPYTPSSNGEKIKQIVISNFNKLTQSNFEQVSDNLVKDLREINCSDVLTILGNEILKKLMYDKGFYKVYIHLCKKLWGLIEWQDSLVSLIKDDDGLYWCENKINVDEDLKINGPYKSETELRKVSRGEVSFKRCLMNMLYGEFCKFDEYLVGFRGAADEDAEFKFRRRMFSNGEFLAELYAAGCIEDKIIVDYFAFLLMMRDFDESTMDILKLELFSQMWKIIGGKIGMRDDIVAHVSRKILGCKLENRIRFMMEDVVGAAEVKEKKVSKTGRGWGTIGGDDGRGERGGRGERSGRGERDYERGDMRGDRRGGGRRDDRRGGGRRDDRRGGGRRRDDGRGGGYGGRRDDRRRGGDWEKGGKRNKRQESRYNNVWNRFGDGVSVVKAGAAREEVDEDKFFEECDTIIGEFMGGDSDDETRERFIDRLCKKCTNVQLGRILMEALFNRSLESDACIDKMTPIISFLLKRKVLRRRYIGQVFKELEGNLEDIELDVPDARVNFERLRGTAF